MKISYAFALLSVFAFASSSQAAKLVAAEGADNVYGLTLVMEDGDAEFDTFDLLVTPREGSIVVPSGDANAITTPGQGGSGFNALLPTPTFLGGKGLSFVGTEATSDKMFQAWASLSGTIDLTPEFFIGNVQLDSEDAIGDALISMYRAGTVVGEASASFPIPEPATAGLAGLAIAGVLGFRRRG